MKKISLLLLATLLLSDTFVTKQESHAQKKQEDKKVKCRVICDKKEYMQESIKAAVEFYKTSPYHTFTKRD